MEFSINSKLNEEDNCWDIDIKGEIDIFNSAEFKELLLELIKEKEINLRLNCQNLSYIDSTGLGSMVGVLKNVRQYDGDMKIINLRPSIAKLFKITNLDKAFIIEVNLDEK